MKTYLLYAGTYILYSCRVEAYTLLEACEIFSKHYPALEIVEVYSTDNDLPTDGAIMLSLN